MVEAMQNIEMSVFMSADMAAMLSILGIGTVKAKHNCCFCKVNNEDTKQQNDEPVRTIENLIEDAESGSFSVKYVPLLKNISLTNYKICSLHMTLRIGEAQLKETINFVLGDTERAKKIQNELNNLSIHWDMTKMTQKTSATSSDFKKISLNKKNIYHLCEMPKGSTELAFESLLKHIDPARPNIDLLRETWSYLSFFVRLVNLPGKLKED